MLPDMQVLPCRESQVFEHKTPAARQDRKYHLHSQ